MLSEIASLSGLTTPTRGSTSASNHKESTSTSHPRLASLRDGLASKANFIFEERIVRVVVFPRYEPIWSIGSLDLFCDAFRVILECHHALAECGILHRDISISNLMFCMVNGQIVGILLDFDLATITDGEGRPPDQTSRFRTGTPRFMAIDLLKCESGPHLYRYDLESFYYALVYIGCHYDRGKKVANGYPEWKASNNLHMAEIKEKFLRKYGGFCLTPTFIPLRNTWIEKLWLLLSDAQMKLRTWKDEKDWGGKQNDDNQDAAEAVPLDDPDTEELLTDITERMRMGAEKDASVLIDLFGNVTFRRFWSVLNFRHKSTSKTA